MIPLNILTMPSPDVVLPLLQALNGFICLGGAFLLLRSEGPNRSRRLLTMVLGWWGLFYGLRLASMLTGAFGIDFVHRSMLDIVTIVAGTFFLFMSLLYPIEVVRPGWLTWGRTFLLFSPYVVLTLIYFIVLAVLDQRPLALQDWQDFVMHAGSFNVWFRFVLILVLLFYLLILFPIVMTYKEMYEQWCSSNYADDEYMAIEWVRHYGIGLYAIGLAYFALLFNGESWTLVLHGLVVLCFFTYVIYRGLFHRNPYTENFFQKTLDEEEARHEADVRDTDGPGTGEMMEETMFISRLSAYCEEVKSWMEEKKPYLDKSFKLMDVAEVLPLNRSYLSRVFNEGFGQSFSALVRDYRMREAESVLLANPNMPVGQVGELCGFSSASVFNRTFVQCHDGVTPKAFRDNARRTA